MQRKRRFVFCGAIAAFLAFGLVGGARANVITLKAASAFPRSHYNNKGFFQFIAAVNKAGKGLVHIKFIGGPEVAPPKQQPIALRNGLFDILFGPSAYYLGLFPEGDFTAGFKTTEEARKDGGYKLVDKVMRAKLGATFLARFDDGLRLYMELEKKPKFNAKGLPDLTGMRMRSSPGYRDFITALGGTPVVMPITQMYTALQRGTVQGVCGDLDSSIEMGLVRFLKYRVEPGFDMAGILVIANAKKFDHLPPKVRNLIQSIAIKYEKITTDEIMAHEKKVKVELDKAGQHVILLKGQQATDYIDTFMRGPWQRMRNNPNIHISVNQLKKDWY